MEILWIDCYIVCTILFLPGAASSIYQNQYLFIMKYNYIWMNLATKVNTSNKRGHCDIL